MWGGDQSRSTTLPPPRWLFVSLRSQICFVSFLSSLLSSFFCFLIQIKLQVFVWCHIWWFTRGSLLESAELLISLKAGVTKKKSTRLYHRVRSVSVPLFFSLKKKLIFFLFLSLTDSYYLVFFLQTPSSCILSLCVRLSLFSFRPESVSFFQTWSALSLCKL